MVGRPLADVAPANAYADLEPNYRAALSGEHRSFEHQSSDGTGWYWTHIAPLIDDGEIVGAVAISQDVTARHEADDALRALTTRFETAFAAAPIGMTLVGLDGRFLRCNQALCDLLGYTEDELLALTFQDITHADDLDIDLAEVRRLLSGEASSYTIEKRYVTRHGPAGLGAARGFPGAGRERGAVPLHLPDQGHHRHAQPGAAAPPAGRPRPRDRPAEPAPVRGRAGAPGRALPPLRRERVPDDPGRGPPQGHQRCLRPPRRRYRPAGGRHGPEEQAARYRPGGPDRGRRVRRASCRVPRRRPREGSPSRSGRPSSSSRSPRPAGAHSSRPASG